MPCLLSDPKLKRRSSAPNSDFLSQTTLLFRSHQALSPAYPPDRDSTQLSWGGEQVWGPMTLLSMDYPRCVPQLSQLAWACLGKALPNRLAVVSLTQHPASSVCTSLRVCKCRGPLTMKPFTMECLDFIEKSQSPPICHLALSTVVILDE